MALTNSYLVTTKNIEPFFTALTTAQAPERFSQKFLESLEFKSSNDRLYIGVLKALGFLDENGLPLKRYYDFLDQTQAGRVLAEGIREAYSDLFAINTKANELDVKEVKNKFRTLTQGKKSDNVLQFMANTFKALCEQADWGVETSPKKEPENGPPVVVPSKEETVRPILEKVAPEFHYNIQIHMPDSRDPAVHEAIFKSLKEHLF
jgi:hypothetical protein